MENMPPPPPPQLNKTSKNKSNAIVTMPQPPKRKNIFSNLFRSKKMSPVETRRHSIKDSIKSKANEIGKSISKRKTINTLTRTLRHMNLNENEIVESLAMNQEMSPEIRLLFNDFKNIKTIRHNKTEISSGANGKVYLLKTKMQNVVLPLVGKVSKHYDANGNFNNPDSLIYDYLVNVRFINKYIKIYPCFIETYGLHLKNKSIMQHLSGIENKLNALNISVNPAMAVLNETNFPNLCVHGLAEKVIVFQQYISPVIRLYDLINSDRDITNDEYLFTTILFQVYFVLCKLKNVYTHNDLHVKNILLYELSSNKKITFKYHFNNKIIKFKCKYIVKIIDNGRAYYTNNRLDCSEHIIDLLKNNINCNKVRLNNGISNSDTSNDDKLNLYGYEFGFHSIHSRVNNKADVYLLYSVIKYYHKKHNDLLFDAAITDETNIVQVFMYLYEILMEYEKKNNETNNETDNEPDDIYLEVFGSNKKYKIEHINTTLSTEMQIKFDNESIRKAIKSYADNNVLYETIYAPIDKWDTSEVTNMSKLFKNVIHIRHDISNWDVSAVTDMSEMFYGAKKFNQPLEKWNVSNVTNMSEMFYGASEFNQPLENWNVSNVTKMLDMFYNAYKFNQPLENWNVSNVTNMASMFRNAYKFNQPLEKWNVSNVTNMSHMFFGAHEFDQPLEKWNVSNVKNMANMFRNAHKFNQPIENWNVSSVTNVNSMFIGANKFNQSLENWKINENISYLYVTMFNDD